ncbi:hypothetical protein [Salinicola sp. RZ23]|uniref:hypothetical protein n=1 Tax=Salinicola sp. RZ23 TaxID=1949087 RepID=UPI000DA13CF4|nr:hypothetical protein [Salinicola sp. RZ23]
MKLTDWGKETPLMKRREQRVLRADSLNALSRQSGIPLSTLKTRVRTLMARGIARERAIEIALSRPVGPQGRPRSHGR